MQLSSPDINYYQHNADDDDDEDEDGYQDPTSLLEGCRYEDVSGMQLNGEDGSYHYAQQGQQQQQTLSQAQIEFLKSMVGFRKKWTPYELRTCNDIRRIIGSREYESLRRKDGMPLPSVKTLRKYRHAAQLPDSAEVMGRKRKLNELDDSPTNLSRAVSRVSAGGGESGPVANHADHHGSGVLFPFGNDTDKEQLKPEQDPDGGHFDVSLLTLPQISFLQTLTMNTKGFSDYELQRSLELKNTLGSGNYETLRKQEFLNIPTLAMLTRYEQDNGLEDLSRMNGRRTGGSERKRRRLAEAAALELVRDQEEQRNRELEEQRVREQQQQQEQEQEQQRQLELYNRLTQADPSRHPLFDSIAGDASPTEGADPVATAAAFAAAMAAAATAGLHPTQLEQLNGSAAVPAVGEDSSMSMFEHHSIFDKDTPMFDMTKLSPAHVEFLNTLPENPKRWTQEMINSALDIKNEIGTRDYEILRRQGIPLPAARTLRRHKDIRNKADRAMSETGEILSASGPVASAGVAAGSG
uniref:Uncharacterized protein n=1 Tax=Anopheles epiroticus TaxID=199890 RepID=A0A182P2D1_9DIPT